MNQAGLVRWRLPLVLLAAWMACGEVRGAAAFRRYRARRVFAPDRSKGTANPFGRSDVLAADFLTTGFARPDGSDIKVFAGKGGAREVSSKVLMMGPGDRARIAIRMVRGVDVYHVCYGGPRNTTRSTWEPDVGLMLETRKFNGGNVRTLAQMQKLVKASGPSYGRWLVPNIFHGLNLFGPSESYVSLYRGWLHVPKAGVYGFATTSDDASYFLIDGKVVSQRNRWGRGRPDTRHKGPPVRLTAGRHRVEYYHVEGTHYQFCVAAWQPPGRKFGLIPASAFPGVFPAKQVDLALRDVRIPIDLWAHAAGELLYETHHLYRVKFLNTTPGARWKGFNERWYFGDGTSSDARNPEHVYMRPGEYTVTFALYRGGSMARVRQKIVVGQDWEHQGQRRGDTSARYHQLVKDYDFPAMQTADLDGVFEFFVTLGADAEIMKSAAALMAKDEPAARKKVYRYAVHLGERLRDVKSLPRDALTVFRAALQLEADEVKQARLVRRVGDTLLYALRRPDEAIAEYQKVLDKFGKLEDNIVRLAQIRVGDAYRAKGDHDRAVAAYRKAEKMLTYKRSHTAASVRRGAFAQSIEDFLVRKEFAQAQNLLDIWGWEYPMERIDGQWSLACAKVALAKGARESACREALECANANKSGRHADALLLFAAGILVEDGRGAEALELARRVQKEYPETGLQETAAQIECQGLYLTRQYHEAARKAAAGYARYKESETAPDFLMVAANAALAGKDYTKAVQLLRLIITDHPQSEAAKTAKVKLKALNVKEP